MAQNPKVPGTGNLLNQFPLNTEETNLNRSPFARVTSQKEAAPEQKRSLNTHSKNCLAAVCATRGYVQHARLYTVGYKELLLDLNTLIKT